MNRRKAIRHEFVDYVPEELEDGVVYVSIRYSTAVHLCCCGCGIEVASPISPADWELTFDGESITLHPSIGNWSLPAVRITGYGGIMFNGHVHGRHAR